MGSMAIKVMLELGEFCLQIWRRPEQGAVEELAPKGADQALHERMRERDIRNRFDFGHSEHPEVGLPLMESIPGIVVGADILRRCLTANRSIEHPAPGRAINDAADQNQQCDG